MSNLAKENHSLQDHDDEPSVPGNSRSSSSSSSNAEQPAIDDPPAKVSVTDKTTGGQRDLETVNSDKSALVVNVKDFERRGILASAFAFVLVAFSILLVERSRYSSFWALPLVAGIGALHAEYARVISEDYVGEAQKAKRDAVHGSGGNQEDSADGRRETVEWLNAIIRKLWPILNTDLLIPILDLVEDALKDEFPRLISSVRIEGLDLGVNAIRVVSMKHLDPDIKIAEKHELESDSSHFVNMEIEFVYEGEERKNASDNTHMIVYIAAGASKLATAELPTFVELKGASGCIRVRAELISDPPFIRMATVSFPTMPAFTLAAKPMKTINVMKFPLITSYVHQAVADVISAFLAPNAFTMDVSRIIMGHDVDLDSHNRGLAVVVIHEAKGLSDTDSGSKSDPFVVVTWSKLGKTAYTTRVIRNELNPKWEEVAFVLVPPDALREGERLSLHVWDSDKFTADDSLGKVEVDLNDLFERTGTIERHEQPLTRAIRGSNAKGTLSFSVGYFALQDFTKGSERAPAGTTIKLKVDGAGAPLLDDPGSRLRGDNFARRIKETIDAKLPPSPKESSGILALQLHQLADLELTRSHQAVGVAARLQETHTPSTYGQIFVNDELVFITRLKRLNSSPYINARTEIFCKDWTRTRVDIVILDYREREEDAVLGTVSMRLVDLLASSSQVTAWRPLVGGIGTGRCRTSILFKPLQIYVPPTLKGWNVGTVLIDRLKLMKAPSDFRGAVSIRLSGDKYRTRTENETLISEDSVLRRYHRSIQLRLVDTSHTFGGSRHIGEGVIWLSEILDDEDTVIRVPLYKGDDTKRRRNNNDVGLPALPCRDRSNSEGTHRLDSAHKIAGTSSNQHLDAQTPYLEISIRFSRGLSSLHSSLLGKVSDKSLVHALRMRDYTLEAGERRAGSARFRHRDRIQKETRQTQLKQARVAAHTQAELHEHRSEQGYRDGDTMHLGLVEAESHGGLSEGAKDQIQNFDLQGDGVDDADPDDADNDAWEADDAEQADEKDPDKTGWMYHKREDMRADRLHHRGAFQVKFVRTAKWMKDVSKRKAQVLNRRINHASAAPVAPEHEGISHL